MKFKKDDLQLIMQHLNLAVKSSMTKDQLIDIIAEKNLDIDTANGIINANVIQNKVNGPDQVNPNNPNVNQNSRGDGNEDGEEIGQDEYLAELLLEQSKQQRAFLEEMKGQQRVFFEGMQKDRQQLISSLVAPLAQSRAPQPTMPTTCSNLGPTVTQPFGDHSTGFRTRSETFPSSRPATNSTGENYNVGSMRPDVPLNNNLCNSNPQTCFPMGNLGHTTTNTNMRQKSASFSNQAPDYFSTFGHLAGPSAKSSIEMDQVFDREFNAVFERRLAEVSRLDSKRFINLHPWVSQFSFIAARHVTITKLETLKNSEIYRCLARFSAVYTDQAPQRVRLYCYVLSKLPMPLNESDQILKTLIRSVDISIETNSLMRTQDIDALYSNYQIERSLQFNHPVPAGSGQYSFRSSNEKRVSSSGNGTQARAKNLCIDYQKGSCTRGGNCRFRHKCEKCDGEHGAHACSK